MENGIVSCMGLRVSWRAVLASNYWGASVSKRVVVWSARAAHGSAKSLLLGALSAQRATEAELEEIRRMLDQFEKKKGTR